MLPIDTIISIVYCRTDYERPPCQSASVCFCLRNHYSLTSKPWLIYRAHGYRDAWCVWGRDGCSALGRLHALLARKCSPPTFCRSTLVAAIQAQRVSCPSICDRLGFRVGITPNLFMESLTAFVCALCGSVSSTQFSFLPYLPLEPSKS